MEKAQLTSGMPTSVALSRSASLESKMTCGPRATRSSKLKSSPNVEVALDMFGQTLYIQGNFLGSQCVATRRSAPVSMMVTSLCAYQPSA